MAVESALDVVDDEVDDVSVLGLVAVLDAADDPVLAELDEPEPDDPPRLSVL